MQRGSFVFMHALVLHSGPIHTIPFPKSIVFMFFELNLRGCWFLKLQLKGFKTGSETVAMNLFDSQCTVSDIYVKDDR